MKPVYNSTYTVKSGDSLWKLAQDYGTTVDVLANLNGIPDDQVGHIYAGQSLTIPNEDAQGSNDYANNAAAGRQDNNPGNCQGTGNDEVNVQTGFREVNWLRYDAPRELYYAGDVKYSNAVQKLIIKIDE